jgi:hypothetical protein
MSKSPPNFCKNRLPDHTDFYTCGNITLPNNTSCLTCRPEQLTRHRRLMQLKETGFLAAKYAYEKLLSEGIPK